MPTRNLITGEKRVRWAYIRPEVLYEETRPWSEKSLNEGPSFVVFVVVFR